MAEKSKPKNVIRQKDNDTDKQHSTIAGFPSTELIKSPVKPPDTEDTEPEKTTRGPTIMFLIGVGVVLFVLGLLLSAIVSTFFGFVVMLIGAVAVVAAVFLPLDS